MTESILLIGLAVLAVVIISKTARVVPQQSAQVIEFMGRYSRTLRAGFHILVPFLDRVRSKLDLREAAYEMPEQVCITKDNVQVRIDAVIYYQVTDAEHATYGITNYGYAIAQLSQTTLRSEIGTMELDHMLQERAAINAKVVEEVSKASSAWGVKVLRYEIRDINPPEDVLHAMEKQLRAEREKRAVVLASEGERDAKINNAEGRKQETIKASEAEQTKQVNEANGEAEAIRAVAEATAEGLQKVAAALQAEGGENALRLRIAEQYVAQFGKIAATNNMVVLPANMGDLGSMIAAATSIIEQSRPAQGRGRGESA